MTRRNKKPPEPDLPQEPTEPSDTPPVEADTLQKPQEPPEPPGYDAQPVAQEPPVEADTPQEPPEPPEPDAVEKVSRLVRVRVHRAISFEGLVLRPDIDTTGRGKVGYRPKIAPVVAVIPRVVAEAHSKDSVEILGDAPTDAKVGLVEVAAEGKK